VFGAGKMAGKTHIGTAAQVFPDLGSISDPELKQLASLWTVAEFERR
jgi:hypothetical protein